MNIDLDNNINELKLLQKDVDAVLAGNADKNFLVKQTEARLSRLTNGRIVFKVSVIKCTSKTPFIVCVYPDSAELEHRAEKLMNKLNDKDFSAFVEEWNSIPKWNIEIDSRLITHGSEICIDNGGQYVAILCHELGHVMNTHPNRLVFNYHKNRAQFKVFEKVIMNKPIMSLLFLPLFVCVSGFKLVVGKPSRDIDEIAADMRVPSEFKPYLIDYMQFHILNRPYNGLIITQEDFDNEQERGIRFTRNCIELMKKRRNMLKLQLATQHKVSESPYFKEICKIASKDVSGFNFTTEKMDVTKDKYVVERIEREFNTALKESNAILEAINVSERDISLLSVDASNIKTPADKTYVLNMIFDYLDALDYQKKKIAKKYKDVDKIPTDATIEMKIKLLRELQKKVMDTPVSEFGDHYGVFVKYPTGYEG